jgi:hypothetical protein
MLPAPPDVDSVAAYRSVSSPWIRISWSDQSSNRTPSASTRTVAVASARPWRYEIESSTVPPDGAWVSSSDIVVGGELLDAELTSSVVVSSVVVSSVVVGVERRPVAVSVAVVVSGMTVVGTVVSSVVSSCRHVVGRRVVGRRGRRSSSSNRNRWPDRSRALRQRCRTHRGSRCRRRTSPSPPTGECRAPSRARTAGHRRPTSRRRRRWSGIAARRCRDAYREGRLPVRSARSPRGCRRTRPARRRDLARTTSPTPSGPPGRGRRRVRRRSPAPCSCRRARCRRRPPDTTIQRSRSGGRPGRARRSSGSSTGSSPVTSPPRWSAGPRSW